MKPGDVVTCSSCGAQAIATWSSAERAWQEGWPLRLSWTHGPHPRHEVTRVAPPECIWCHELHQVVPGAEPRYRPAPGAPAPVPPPPPAAPDDPIARYDALADAFYRETRIWPPGRDRPAEMGSDGISDEERQAAWIDWLKKRNAAAAATRSPAKPKKGTQLDMFGGRP